MSRGCATLHVCLVALVLQLVRESGEVGTLLITHYTRILRYIKPDFVHVFSGGRIVESGGAELADKLENEGYEAYTKGGVSA